MLWLRLSRLVLLSGTMSERRDDSPDRGRGPAFAFQPSCMCSNRAKSRQLRCSGNN